MMSMHADMWADAQPLPRLGADLEVAGLAGEVEAPDAADPVELLLPLARSAVDAVVRRRAAARPRAGAYLRALALLVDGLPRDAIARCVALLLATRHARRHIFLLGIGESAATASGFAGDLSRQWAGLQSPAVTYIGGPYPFVSRGAGEGYASRLREGLHTGDVVLAVARGGEVDALAPALEVAVRSGATTVLITGQGQQESATVDLALVVDTHRPEHVHGAHLYVAYLTCAALAELEAARLTTPEPAPYAPCADECADQ